MRLRATTLVNSGAFIIITKKNHFKYRKLSNDTTLFEEDVTVGHHSTSSLALVHEADLPRHVVHGDASRDLCLMYPACCTVVQWPFGPRIT